MQTSAPRPCSSPEGEDTNALALGALRFSLGRETTAEEIDAVVARVADLLTA